MATEQTENKYNLEMYELYRDKLDQFLKSHPKIKQAHVAKALNGVASPTLGQWIKGGYTGNVDRITEEISNYLQHQKEKEAVQRRDDRQRVSIRNMQVILNLARDCHLQGKIGVVYGDSSLGKTESVKEYASRYSNAVLIESEYGYSPKVLVKKIADAIGLGTEGQFNEQKERVLDGLRGSDRLIIVDEAENLPTASLEFLRRIYDKTGVGLFYTGMPRLIYNLRGNKGQFKQLYSRVRFSYKLRSLEEEDIRALLETTYLDSTQIDKFFGVFYTYGKSNIRRLFNMVDECQRLQEINAAELSKDIVDNAVNMTSV